MAQLKLFPAGAPELVKCNQKDRFYTEHLTSLLSDITRQVFPLRFWLKWQRELQLLAELGYYGVTTMLGNQSLGEEYCNVVQVGPSRDAGQWVAAGFGRRLLSVLLQTFGVYAIEKWLEMLHRRVGDRNLGLTLSEREYQVLENVLGALEDFVSGVSKLHLALFYIHGLYYYLGKRVSAIKYLMIRHSTSQSQELSSLSTYSVLGWLILAQISVQVTKLLYKAVKKRREVKGKQELPTQGEDSRERGMKFAREAVESNVTSSFKCPLCLELCENHTATVCGHIFCWKCISEWTSEKSECPVCRNHVQPQQIVCLQHFKM